MDYYKDNCLVRSEQRDVAADNESRKLFSENLKGMEKVLNSQKNLRRNILRERLEELRLKGENPCNNNDRSDAVTIFPEELWAVIFQYVTDDNDLLSCIRTCTLFETILKEEQTNVLFEKTFPLICHKLDKEDVLSCRGVSQKWCCTVDTFLESLGGVQVHYRNPEEPYTGSQQGTPLSWEVSYSFRIPPLTGNDLSRDDMRLHQRNPLVGRTALLNLKSPELEYDMEIEQNLEQFLDDFGDHLGNIHISGVEQFPISIPTWEYYPMCLQILTKCPDLRSLTLDHITVNWPHRGLSQFVAINSKPPLPPHSNVKVLTILNHAQTILPIQDTLLVVYSEQLEFLQVCHWNQDLYHDLPWNNLTQLVISQRNSSEWLPCLMDMEALNLIQLELRLDGPQFEIVMSTLEHFQTIQKLTLHLEMGYSIEWKSELPSYTRGGRPINCSGTVTCLQLKLSLPINDFNFLICFPLLKRLEISTNMEGSCSSEEADFLNVRNLIWPREQDNDLVRMQVYQCKLWEVLSNLEVLKITKAAGTSFERLKVYSRLGFEQFCQSQQC